MDGGQREAPAEARRASRIPSQDVGTQMSHETPGMCVWKGGGVGMGGGAVIAWMVSQLLPAES